MFTYISVEEFADGVVKNNKDTNRKELITSLRQAAASQGRTCASPAPPERPTTARTTRSNKQYKRGAICSALAV